MSFQFPENRKKCVQLELEPLSGTYTAQSHISLPIYLSICLSFSLSISLSFSPLNFSESLWTKESCRKPIVILKFYPLSCQQPSSPLCTPLFIILRHKPSVWWTHNYWLPTLYKISLPLGMKFLYPHCFLRPVNLTRSCFVQKTCCHNFLTWL